MFKTNYHATVGFTRVIDRACPTCKGIYSSNEHSVCPKCNVALVVPMANTTKGLRPYCFTEVTIYPIMDEKGQKAYVDKVQKSKALGFMVRLKLWGHYDEANNIVLPDNRTKYLTPKKQILVETNNPPIYNLFTTKEKKTVVQILHEITHGDRITFVGAKDNTAVAAPAQVAPAPKPAEVKQTTVVNNSTAELMELGKTIMDMTKRFETLMAGVNTTKQAPAPTMVETNEVNVMEMSAPDPDEDCVIMDAPYELFTE